MRRNAAHHPQTSQQQGDHPMADIVYLLVFISFFAVAAVFVRACEAIIGPDEQAVPERRSEPQPESMAA
jgi:hypothetical protein